MEPTWWIDPKGERVLVLEVSSSLEDGGPDDYECAVIPMTRDLARAIFARMDLVRLWKQAEPSLQSAEFSDYTAEYYGVYFDAEDESGNCPPDWDNRGDWDGRTDVDRLEVSDDWAGWTAYVKNTDIRLMTAQFTRDTLAKYIEGAEPWPTGGTVAAAGG